MKQATTKKQNRIKGDSGRERRIEHTGEHDHEVLAFVDRQLLNRLLREFRKGRFDLWLEARA
jgi:hypothetical protein